MRLGPVAPLCTSGKPQGSSQALPYGALKRLGEADEKACGERLSTVNGANVCPKCDLLPRRTL